MNRLLKSMHVTETCIGIAVFLCMSGCSFDGLDEDQNRALTFSH